MDLAERFWEKVMKDSDCWNWIASCRPNGYGQFGIGGKNYSAPRISWELVYGKIPEGMQILHCCDNRKCVKPTHLFLGIPKDNVRDMRHKHRENNTGPKIDISKSYVIGGRRTKLSWEDVNEIRRLGRLKSARKIAKIYNLSSQHVGDILANRKWKEK